MRTAVFEASKPDSRVLLVPLEPLVEEEYEDAKELNVEPIAEVRAPAAQIEKITLPKGEVRSPKHKPRLAPEMFPTSLAGGTM